MPSNSTICPRNGPKRRQKAPKTAQCAPTSRNQARAVSWATWLKNEFRGHLVHPQPLTFGGFRASESPNETRRPPYQWSLGVAGGPASPRTVGANGGSTRVPRAKKMIFSKVVPRPLRMLKQVFLGRFEPVVARFGPWKIPKCLQNGPFWDQQWVKNGSKTHFSKNDPGPFMMFKQVVLAHFEPVATGFGSWKMPKCLENGPFWDQKWVKNGSKTCFSRSDSGPFGMLKKVFVAHFEPVLTEFSPFHHMFAPLCALRAYVTTKPTPNSVHSPTPGQLHVESIQLACICALCCCYALCMKREELSIFYSLWLRCFVVMLQYVGFLGRSQLFGSQVKIFSQVGAPSRKLARQKSGVGAPNRDLARQNCQVGARQVRLSRAPTAQSRAPNSWIGGGTLGARQLDSFGAPT